MNNRQLRAVGFGLGSFLLMVGGMGQSLAAEMTADREQNNKKLLAKYDVNKNGILDPEEIQQIARDRMARFDRNNDGKVDQAELKLLRQESKQSKKQSKEQRALAIQRANADAKAFRAAKERKETPAPKGKKP